MLLAASRVQLAGDFLTAFQMVSLVCLQGASLLLQCQG